MINVTNRLEVLAGRLFPASDKEASNSEEETHPVRTFLCHDSLSCDNILVDENGMLTGVIDWQCIPCLPLHQYCQFPAFLQQTHDRHKEPTGHRYLIDKDGPPHPAYRRDLKRHEITNLRIYFLEEMLKDAHEFVETWGYNASADLLDYEVAVQNCDNEFTVDIVEQWVKMIEEGGDLNQQPMRLHERLAGE
jgi:hypothetical protein